MSPPFSLDGRPWRQVSSCARASRRRLCEQTGWRHKPRLTTPRRMRSQVKALRAGRGFVYRFRPGWRSRQHRCGIDLDARIDDLDCEAIEPPWCRARPKLTCPVEHRPVAGAFKLRGGVTPRNPASEVGAFPPRAMSSPSILVRYARAAGISTTPRSGTTSGGTVMIFPPKPEVGPGCSKSHDVHAPAAPRRANPHRQIRVRKRRRLIMRSIATPVCDVRILLHCV